ncbi:MAG: GNAT family N-acetyltransferase [Spirochaetota bacterium]
MQSSDKLTTKWIRNVADVSQADWDRLALPLQTPFLEWGFLHAIEQGGCVDPESGWLPNHLLLYNKKDLVAIAPLYIKGHSYGEFVFDQEWAHVAMQMGLEYYPKLLGAVPFTPTIGYRFLLDPTYDQDQLNRIILKEIDSFCMAHNILGSHFLFVEPSWGEQIQRLGYHAWLHSSLIWQGAGESSFPDYLQRFDSHRRRTIKQERKKIAKQALDFRVLTGEQISTELLANMYEYYNLTCSKFHYFSKYLTKQFFLSLRELFAERLALVCAFAEDSDVPKAMSFLVHKDQHVYGRYWGGQSSGQDYLHFEACYYQPIEWCIANGKKFYDAGSGGYEHKRRRGFLATPNHSLHRFYNEQYDTIWQKNIHRINLAQERQIEAINEK